MPTIYGDDEWHPYYALPLMGGAGEAEKYRLITPTLILPHQGGGDI